MPMNVELLIPDFLKGREKLAPLSAEMEQNMNLLLEKVGILLTTYGKNPGFSSGYRPPSQNAAAGGAKKSCHLTCEAVDIIDTDRKFRDWVLSHLYLLERLGLYLENPASTPTWIHLQTRRPGSGNRVFNP